MLWFGSNEKEALSLMSEITRQIKEGETKTANEMVCSSSFVFKLVQKGPKSLTLDTQSEDKRVYGN